MRFLPHCSITVFALIFIFGMTPCLAESTAPYERHDRSHKMADDSHEQGVKDGEKAFKCACCEGKKKDKAHGDMYEKRHQCGQGCEHHKMGHGQDHGNKKSADLEDLFK